MVRFSWRLSSAAFPNSALPRQISAICLHTPSLSITSISSKGQRSCQLFVHLPCSEWGTVWRGSGGLSSRPRTNAAHASRSVICAACCRRLPRPLQEAKAKGTSWISWQTSTLFGRRRICVADVMRGADRLPTAGGSERHWQIRIRLVAEKATLSLVPGLVVGRH